MIEYSGMVSLEELEVLIRKYFKVGTIVLIARCSIDYRGRAMSRASQAKRLIIIKEDGTVLVHEGRGREPINWQPQSHLVIRRGFNNELIITAVRLRPREELKIIIKDAAYIVVSRLTTARFVLEGAEKDLIDMIARNPSIVEEGAKLVSREVATPHGRVDIVLRSKNGDLIVVEVKRSLADIDAVYQLRRYVEYYSSLGINVRGFVAAPKITPQARKLLQKFGLNYVRVVLSS